MATIYEATYTYQYIGQVIANILYYVNLAAPSAAWTPEIAQGLADAGAAHVSGNLMSEMPVGVTGELVEVRALDEFRSVLSTFTVQANITTDGGQPGTLGGAANCGIVNFRMLPSGVPGITRVPRRSYIAFGPLQEESVSPTQQWLLDVLLEGFIESYLTNSYTVLGDLYTACRLGVPTTLGGPSLGIVNGITFSNFTSFRRSRLIPPDGQGG
jgi:hypothetical protein